MFRFVDLFAGCGGLSLGLRANGGIDVLGVEKARDAAHTYFHNLLPDAGTFEDHLRRSPEEQVSAGLLVDTVEKLLELEWRPTESIDVVVGGPPCQGFSLAGRRKEGDARNQLVWRFLDVVASLRPKIVVIENVEGMNRVFAVRNDAELDRSSTFAQVLAALQKTGPEYETFGVRVNAMHYGAAQHRPRLMAIGVRRDVAHVLGVVSSTDVWSSSFEAPVDRFVPLPTVSAAFTVADAIGDLAKSKPERDANYLEHLRSEHWNLPGRAAPPLNNDQRAHRPETRQRFRLLQLLTTIGANPRLLGPMTPAHRDTAMRELASLLNAKAGAQYRLGTDVVGGAEVLRRVRAAHNGKHSQRALRWTTPARTVMTIPDDHVHPDEPRTFTVREMARFQGFPDAFEFKGKVTTGGQSRQSEVPQYSQVGNAVSPLVAEAVARMIGDLLDRYDRALVKD